MVAAGDLMDVYAAYADALVGQHVIEGDQGNPSAARAPRRDQPLSGGVRRVPVAGADQVAYGPVVQGRVEVAEQESRCPVRGRVRLVLQVLPPVAERSEGVRGEGVNGL